jgi:hypothetical protein
MWAGGDGLDGGAAEMRRGRAIASGLRRRLFTCKQGALARCEPDQGLGRVPVYIGGRVPPSPRRHPLSVSGVLVGAGFKPAPASAPSGISAMLLRRQGGFETRPYTVGAVPPFMHL